MLQENFNLLGIQRLQQILFLSRKKKTWISLLMAIKVKWKGVAEDLKRASFSFFLRFAMHSFYFIGLHVLFFQANFTFSFVENLKTYSETWLRMSEVFKTSGNILTVSHLQVGELGWLPIFWLLSMWCRQIFYACKIAPLIGFRFKNCWKGGSLVLGLSLQCGTEQILRWKLLKLILPHYDQYYRATGEKNQIGTHTSFIHLFMELVCLSLAFSKSVCNW